MEKLVIEDTFARLKGVNRWIETDATVFSPESISDGIYDEGPPLNRLIFTYVDQAGSLQSGGIKIDSLTSLYNLRVNEKFRIRFQPGKPARFYCSEATSAFNQLRLVFWITVIAAGIPVAALLLLRCIKYHQMPR